MVVSIDVSTLHGTIITIPVEPRMLVRCVKQKCMDASPFHLTPLEINADLAHLMRDCSIDDLIGIRLSTWDGRLLQDGETIGSQVSTINTLFKLVFMKQYDLNHHEMAMAMEFANLARGISHIAVRMPQYDTHFFVRPVWGDGSRSNHILGLLYQHSGTEHHCQLKGSGVNPMQVDFNYPVTIRRVRGPQT
jgi:hypothetical protein